MALGELQPVQNAAALIVMGMLRYAYVTPQLCELATVAPLSLCFLMQFQVLVMTYKALDVIGPSYLKEYFFPLCTAVPSDLI